MRLSTEPRPSLSVLALAAAVVFATAGTTLAGSESMTGELSKSQVKKIAKKQIKKSASGLSVASADSAYARALITAEPLGVSLARNIEQSQLDNPRVGVYCLDLDFTPVGVQVTDETDADVAAVTLSAVIDPLSQAPPRREGNARGNAFNGCDPGTDLQVTAIDTGVAPPTRVNTDFFLEVSR